MSKYIISSLSKYIRNPFVGFGVVGTKTAVLESSELKEQFSFVINPMDFEPLTG
jgi:hypothetical protein